MSDRMAHEYVLQPSQPRGATIDYAAALNPEQLAAATARPGPILVIAGAGSGKTRTLTYRVAYLIENGVDPRNILLLTFTNKAAREMLERVAGLVPNDTTRLWGGTFHHVGHRLLRRHANVVDYGTDFTIMDSEDASAMAADARDEAGLNAKDLRVPKGDLLVNMYGLAVNKEVPLSEIIEEAYPHLLPLADGLIAAHEAYRERKRSSNVMDYDDLLALTVLALREDEGVRRRYQEQFAHLLVDEYQDTSKIQASLIDILAEGHKQVMVVGDDAQSIYSWRGADFRNILEFPERYEGTQVIRIETNYRSTPEILTLANAAIAPNTKQFEKNLRSVRPAEKLPKPALVAVNDANMQSAFICQRITELANDGVPLPEIAVLYRSHFHAMELQLELSRRNIPYDITSGIRFFEQAHIKDVAAFLRLSVNRRDEPAFKRIVLMLPGIGKKSADKLWDSFVGGQGLAELNPPSRAKDAWQQLVETDKQLRADDLRGRPSEQIQVVIDAMYEDYAKSKYTNYASRLEDLAQLRAFSQTFDNTEDFLGQLSLLTNMDGGPKRSEGRRAAEEDEEKIRLSTIHQAKGLEWRHVFVIMLCDGMFPSSRSLETDHGEEEERRLFYVAVTRARDELYLTYPRMRASAGSGDYWQEPSRFVEELPDDLMNEWVIKPPRPSWEDEDQTPEYDEPF